MKSPITPDPTDALIVSLSSGIIISLFLVFALYLFDTAKPQGNRAFSTAEVGQVFRYPF